MPRQSPDDIKSTLMSKFKFEPVKGTKHGAIAFFYQNKKIATTRFSRGSNIQVGDALLKLMAGQVRIDKLGFFKEMLDCTKSRQDYIEKLITDGYIEIDEE